MADGERLSLHSIPARHAFGDSLVAGIMRRVGADPTALARSLILLPNNRAVRAVTDAFVRASGGGLLLPRMVPLGDPDSGDAMGSAMEAADLADPPPPAVAPYARRMILTRLIVAARAGESTPVGVAEAARLAGELERLLDQLLVEEVDPARLATIDLAEDLSAHWQASLRSLEVVLHQWPVELARLGRIEGARRRALLLDRLERRWRERPPSTLVCAAGITDPAPAVTRLLRCIAGMPSGLVVFAGLDAAMPDEEWAALGPHPADPATGLTPRSIETHPQFVPKLMLERIGAGRAEVAEWSEAAGTEPARGRAVANALAPAAFSGKWTALKATDRRLAGVTAAEFAIPGEEAQAVALALRAALEMPGRTAALVTPDRALARRVAAHCRRWAIDVDDSAGRPLAILPPGTLLLALAEAAAERFAPLALLTLLKHPLACGGGDRLAWLDGVRRLDRRLRGPRPAPGLGGIGDLIAGTAAQDWWSEARALLQPVEAAFARGQAPLAEQLACLREVAGALAGEALWVGPAGRAAATFLADLEAEALAGPALVDPGDLPVLLRMLLGEVAVRRPPGLDHPRLAIYGQIEARLQSADLLILGGLNEGVWPGTPAPDPWLAPRIRSALGLPGLERRIGIAAHDLAQGLGAPQVLLTRARRDAGGPTLPSRFWLRLQAMAGEGFARDTALEGWTRALDDPGEHRPADRPHPRPKARPAVISVTEVDRLKADPFAFYARRCLGLSPLDAVDAEPSAAWRGSEVHRILEAWWKEDRCAPDSLRPRALAMLADERTHPIIRALWQPRLVEAIDWIAARVAEDAAAGRHVAFAEGQGRIAVAGVTLTGRYDRIDTLPGGGIAIVDYKTGKAPSVAAVRAGFSLQLGLLGLMAERGGFEGVAGPARGFEYWSLAKDGDRFGKVSTPVDDAGKRDRIPTSEFVAVAAENFAGAAAKWLTGDEPFTAKLVPDYAIYADYDQLMRRDEWYGRD